MRTTISVIVETVRDAVDETPPELIADLMHDGVVLAGGGALLHGLDTRLSEETRMKVRVAESPLTCVARGAEAILEELPVLRKVLASMQRGSTIH
jgi:rod shape-determining protein MreB